ncbi:MAG: thermonuclease family protein [Candidatus Muirbacterium halophilum]|nr:thermonuclease family protein [Candidatus Muirbacterium halophilum]
MKNIIKKIITILILTSTFVFSQSMIQGVVVGVSDGDTLKILDYSKKLYKIRLAEIDAPEKSQDFGQASKKSLSDMCYKKNAVAYVANIDRYGRSIARVFCGNKDVNFNQVSLGMAWVYRQYSNNQSLMQAESIARRKNIGLWQLSNPVAPWEYRRTKRPAFQ